MSSHVLGHVLRRLKQSTAHNLLLRKETLHVFAQSDPTWRHNRELWRYTYCYVDCTWLTELRPGRPKAPPFLGAPEWHTSCLFTFRFHFSVSIAGPLRLLPLSSGRLKACTLSSPDVHNAGVAHARTRSKSLA